MWQKVSIIIILMKNHQISAVDMHVGNLDNNKLICYPAIQENESIIKINSIIMVLTTKTLFRKF